MAILHYTIGLPPKRNGGSVQYAYGLMCEQAKTEKVIALICGETLFRGRKTKIKKVEERNGFEVFALTNPLTPTLIYGTRDPMAQYRNVEVDYDNVREFIIENHISVLHLHTLMGLPAKIIQVIKSLGVKIVYTSHDFHGICPHYNLIDYRGEVCEKAEASRCALCNQNEPSDLFLRLASSSLYHNVKKSGILKLLKKPSVKVNDRYKGEPLQVNNNRVKEYETLLNYYIEYFDLVDKVHFNSSQTKQVFQHFLPHIKGRVIPVITSGIKDKRTSVNLTDKVKFGFIGSTNEYKGFPILKSIMTELFKEGYRNFTLQVYSGNPAGVDVDCPLIEYCPPYTYGKISEVMYSLDCIIVPSKWYETFSLVALEALAHGRPAIVSDHVGAKDIVSNYNDWMIFSSKQELKDMLKRLLDNPIILLKESMKINQGLWPFSLENHSKEIMSFYNE